VCVFFFCYLLTHSLTHSPLLPTPWLLSCSVSVVLRGAVDTLETEPMQFSYLPPTIDLVLPSTMDADKESVTIVGKNFGRAQDVRYWSPEEAMVNVTIGACASQSKAVPTFFFQPLQASRTHTRSPSLCSLTLHALRVGFPSLLPLLVCVLPGLRRWRRVPRHAACEPWDQTRATVSHGQAAGMGCCGGGGVVSRVCHFMCFCMPTHHPNNRTLAEVWAVRLLFGGPR
jgi:hypothetical protein